MKICYMEEKYAKYNFFRKIELVQDKENIFAKVPIDTKIKKVPINIKRIVAYLYDNCINNVVLSEELLKKEVIKNYLFSSNINILEDIQLFKYLSNDMIKLIYKYSNRNMHNSECSILLNDASNFSNQQITDLAIQFKRINIISSKQKQFEKIAEYLYSELGIIIKVSNNKKQDLMKSEVILNVDYPEELLNDYRLQNRCIIINVLHDVRVKKKQFTGININSFNINIPENKKIYGFNNKHICEAMLYKNEILPKVEITELIGKKGSISKREFISVFA